MHSPGPAAALVAGRVGDVADDEHWQIGGSSRSRQDHAAAAGRLGRGERRSGLWRHDAGPGTVAHRLRPGQTVQDRQRPLVDRRRGGGRQDLAGRHPDGGRPHQRRWWHQRPSRRTDRRGRRDDRQRSGGQGEEARSRGSRRPDRRRHLQFDEAGESRVPPSSKAAPFTSIRSNTRARSGIRSSSAPARRRRSSSTRSFPG